MKDILEAFVYPVCLAAGLLGGLVARRLPFAALIGFVVAPALDAAASQAFSDAQPRFRPWDSLSYAVAGALIALAVCAVKHAIQRSRKRSAG